MKSTLIVYGGWDDHQPKKVSQLLHDALVKDGFSVEMSDTLDALLDGDKLKSLDLIVPIWTMGALKRENSPRCWKRFGAASASLAAMAACAKPSESHAHVGGRVGQTIRDHFGEPWAGYHDRAG